MKHSNDVVDSDESSANDGASSRALLTVDSLEVDFGRKPILGPVNLTARAGEIVGVIGPNGGGKTTLLRGIAGDFSDARGRIFVGDRLFSRIEGEDRAKTMAFVPANLGAPFSFTVAELVGLGSSQRGALASPVLMPLLEALDLNEIVHRSLATLSSGQRQRASIARGLAQQPRLLVLDEPFSHQDPGHIGRILRVLRQFSRDNRGVVLSLHDPGLAISVADRLWMVRDGQVESVSPGEPEIIESLGTRLYDTPLNFFRPGNGLGDISHTTSS